MKTLIVGSGVIGVVYGWALQQAGVDVTHFVRPGKKDQFPDGVTLDLLDERKGYPPKSTPHYPIRCVDSISPADGHEIIVIPTNAQQVEGALKTLVPVSGDATLLIFSGNWDGLAAYDAILPRERYLLGYPDGGGTIRDGVYWTNLGPEVHLGLLEGQSTERLEQVKSDPAKASLDEKEKAMLLFVLKAVDDPDAVGAEDVDKLRELGWTDKDLVEAVHYGADMVRHGIVFKTFKMGEE